MNEMKLTTTTRAAATTTTPATAAAAAAAASSVRPPLYRPTPNGTVIVGHAARWNHLDGVKDELYA